MYSFNTKRRITFWLYNCRKLTHANHLETLTTVNSTPSQSIETCTVVLIHPVIIIIPTLSLSTVGGTM